MTAQTNIEVQRDQRQHYRDGGDHRARATLTNAPRLDPGSVTGITVLRGAR